MQGANRGAVSDGFDTDAFVDRFLEVLVSTHLTDVVKE